MSCPPGTTAYQSTARGGTPSGHVMGTTAALDAAGVGSESRVLRFQSTGRSMADT